LCPALLAFAEGRQKGLLPLCQRAASLPHPLRAILGKSSGARRGKREKYILCVTSVNNRIENPRVLIACLVIFGAWQFNFEYRCQTKGHQLFVSRKEFNTGLELSWNDDDCRHFYADDVPAFKSRGVRLGACDGRAGHLTLRL
jgi:hypothetical protein